MKSDTLFVAWQDDVSREWFPVGQLETDLERPLYRFRYTSGAERAQCQAGFPLLMEFPQLRGHYESDVLFPTFTNRIMHQGRPDFAAYMLNLGFEGGLDPIGALAVSGGYRTTDPYEIFPKIEKQADGSFACRFFLHGNRHTNQPAQDRIKRLREGDDLYVTLELTNPATVLAVQVQTKDYHMIGWAPRYLVYDLVKAMAESPTSYKAHVVRVNPPPAPKSCRILIEMTGYWAEHEPMSGKDYQPLVRCNRDFP